MTPLSSTLPSFPTEKLPVEDQTAVTEVDNAAGEEKTYLSSFSSKLPRITDTGSPFCFTARSYALSLSIGIALYLSLPSLKMPRRFAEKLTGVKLSAGVKPGSSIARRPRNPQSVLPCISVRCLPIRGRGVSRVTFPDLVAEKYPGRESTG